MSAGNFMGTIFNCVMASAMWITLGLAVDKVGQVFNHVIQVLPSFQDAVNGFTITQTIWLILLVIIWIVLWINFATNEASEAGGLV